MAGRDQRVRGATPPGAPTVAPLQRSPSVQVCSEVRFEADVVRLRGVVHPGGLRTTYYFQWGPSAGYGTTGAVEVVAAGSEPVPVQLAVPAPLPGATCHYRLVASNALGSAVSANCEFTGRTVAPAVVTGPAEHLDMNAAGLTGTVNPHGAPAAWSFEYGPTEDYGLQTPGGLLPLDTGPVEVTEHLWNLRPDSTYHYRLVARRGGEVCHGEDRILLTAPARSLAAVLRAERERSGRFPAFVSPSLEEDERNLT